MTSPEALFARVLGDPAVVKAAATALYAAGANPDDGVSYADLVKAVTEPLAAALAAALPTVAQDEGAALSAVEWNEVCRAAGPEHTEDACDGLKVAVERIIAARLAALAAALPTVAQDEGAAAADLLRWLGEARKDYCHKCPEHSGDYEAMTATQIAVHEEHMAASWLANIVSGENDAKGWLPSWRWDEYAARLAAVAARGDTADAEAVLLPFARWLFDRLGVTDIPGRMVANYLADAEAGER